MEQKGQRRFCISQCPLSLSKSPLTFQEDMKVSCNRFRFYPHSSSQVYFIFFEEDKVRRGLGKEIAIMLSNLFAETTTNNRDVRKMFMREVFFVSQESDSLHSGFKALLDQKTFCPFCASCKNKLLYVFYERHIIHL